MDFRWWRNIVNCFDVWMFVVALLVDILVWISYYFTAISHVNLRTSASSHTQTKTYSVCLPKWQELGSNERPLFARAILLISCTFAISDLLPLTLSCHSRTSHRMLGGCDVLSKSIWQTVWPEFADQLKDVVKSLLNHLIIGVTKTNFCLLVGVKPTHLLFLHR